MAEEPSKFDISDEMIAERRGGSGKMPEDMPSWMAKSIINIAVSYTHLTLPTNREV